MSDFSSPQSLHIELDHRFANHFHLQLDVRLPGKGVIGVIGESGCGKTTLLRCVAGLLKPDQGIIKIRDQLWQGQQHFVPAHQRHLGYVFQEARLFPHLNVLANIHYGLNRRQRDQNKDNYQSVLEVTGVAPLLKRQVHNLSGGERQRVAIARAILTQPRLLLMDEPLASLDMQRRLDILPYLEKLHQHADFPIIYVSHSLPEIARLADFVLLMKKGKVLASGSASHVLTRLDLPITKNEESCAILDTQVVEQQPQWNLMKVTFEGGYLWLPISAPTGSHIRVSVLARDVSLSLHQQKDSSILNSVKVQLDEINTDTDATFAMVRLKIANQYLLSRTTRKSLAHLAVQPGDILWAQIKSAAIVHG